MVSFGQEFEDMSQLSKERIKFPMEEKIIRGGTPVLKWIVGNVVMWQELAGHSRGFLYPLGVTFTVFIINLC